jgi:hypothetical protein
MRFALAVLGAGAVQSFAFTQLTGPRSVPVLALVTMLLAASGAGFFAARRGALAGLVSLYLGALAYAGASYFAAATVPDAPRDPLDLIGWVVRLGFAIVPYAIGTAVAGWAGTAARRRLLAW